MCSASAVVALFARHTPGSRWMPSKPDSVHACASGRGRGRVCEDAGESACEDVRQRKRKREEEARAGASEGTSKSVDEGASERAMIFSPRMCVIFGGLVRFVRSVLVTLCESVESGVSCCVLVRARCGIGACACEYGAASARGASAGGCS